MKQHGRSTSRTSPMRTLQAALCCALVGLLADEQNALAAEAVPAETVPAETGPVERAASRADAAPSRAAAARARADASAGRTQVRLDEDVITGSSELPKVLYILPWRAAEGTAGLNAAPVLKAKELFEPLDPDAHLRLLQYRQRLLGDPADGG